MAKFVFTLQSALERAEREQRQAERDLAAARAAARTADRELVEFAAPLEQIEQQIRDLDDKFRNAPACGLSEARRCVERAARERAELLARRRLAELEARCARHKTTLRQTELGWAMNRLEAFRRLKAQELAAFAAQNRLREDRSQEELANLRSARQASEGVR